MTALASTPEDFLWGSSSYQRKPSRLFLVRSVPSSPAADWEQPQQDAKFAEIEAKKALAKLNLDARLRSQVQAFLSDATEPDSTVPSVALADEDTVILHWISGPTTIEVEIPEDGPLYFWSTTTGDETADSFEGSYFDVMMATRAALGEVAKRVNKNNPSWREQYLRQ